MIHKRSFFLQKTLFFRSGCSWCSWMIWVFSVCTIFRIVCLSGICTYPLKSARQGSVWLVICDIGIRDSASIVFPDNSLDCNVQNLSSRLTVITEHLGDIFSCNRALWNKSSLISDQVLVPEDPARAPQLSPGAIVDGVCVLLSTTSMSREEYKAVLGGGVSLIADSFL